MQASKILSEETREETVSLFACSEVKSKRDRDPLLQPDPTSAAGGLEQEVRVKGSGISARWRALAAERELRQRHGLMRKALCGEHRERMTCETKTE